MTLRQVLQAATKVSVYRTSLDLGICPSTMYAALRGRLAFSKTMVEKVSTVVPNVRDFLDAREMVKEPC